MTLSQIKIGKLPENIYENLLLDCAADIKKNYNRDVTNNKSLLKTIIDPDGNINYQLNQDALDIINQKIQIHKNHIKSHITKYNSISINLEDFIEVINIPSNYIINIYPKTNIERVETNEIYTYNSNELFYYIYPGFSGSGKILYKNYEEDIYSGRIYNELDTDIYIEINGHSNVYNILGKTSDDNLEIKIDAKKAMKKYGMSFNISDIDTENDEVRFVIYCDDAYIIIDQQ